MPRGVGVRTAIDAGARTLLITIEQLTEGTADSNFPTESWQTLLQTWAARDYLTLDEATKLNQLSAMAVMQWEIAYAASMDPDLIDIAKQRRVRYKARTYDVISAEVLPHQSGRSIILTTLVKVG